MRGLVFWLFVSNLHAPLALAIQLGSPQSIDCPENLEVVSGSTKDFYWAEGWGCINRPTNDVWILTHDHNIMQWAKVSENTLVSSVAHPPLEEREYDYTVRKMVTVRWRMKWTYDLVSGSTVHPREWTLSYRKIQGTRFIPHWQGEMRFQRLDNTNTTRFWMKNEVRALRTSQSDAAKTIRETYEKLRLGVPPSAIPYTR